jgi:16S rRNA (cytosine967-C5)-methyltransferase
MISPNEPGHPEGLASRQAALDLVQAALDQRGGLDEAMTRASFAELDARDRALARMLAMTLLRRLGAIDRLLEPRLRKPPPAPVMMLLRLGVAQARYLDTPPFAAVDTTVRLAEQEPTARPFKGLINAVLRGLLRDAPAEPETESFAPAWLFARWRSAYGEAAARATAAMIVEEPAFDLTPRAPSDVGALAELLQAEALPGGSLRLRGRGDVADWPAYAEGRWWVQDAAAAIPARLLQAKPGERVLDLCAAPGGKTLQLAAAGAEVTALDRSASRLKRLAESLARTGLAAETVVADATRWADPRQFDAILLDAPCTATGTFRRHPDVLWGTRPSDIAQLAGLQTRLLDANADRVKRGGRLVYCVCSLEPEEGEAQIAAFLRRRPDFRLAAIEAGESGAPEASVTAAGLLRILPHHRPDGLDGFFAARIERTGGG